MDCRLILDNFEKNLGRAGLGKDKVKRIKDKGPYSWWGKMP